MRGFGALVAVSWAMAPAAAHADGPTGRILIGLAAAADVSDVARDAGVRLSGPAVPQIGLATARPAPGTTTAGRIDRLQRDPRVRYAVAEGSFDLRYEPNDPAFFAPEPDADATSGATLQWPLAKQGFTRAWDVTTGEDAVVAILDTGIDGAHPDLQGKVLDAVDLHGGSDDPATVDTDGHGTHVASLACARSDNGLGIAGAGFGCRLLILKTDLTDASVAEGIVLAADRGAHALNMSFGDDGSDPSPALADAVRYAVERGVVLVAAGADEPIEEQGEPANLLQPTGSAPDVHAGIGLSVTAATIDDERAAFAGRGTQISLASYGALRTDSGTRGILGLYPAAETPRERPSVVPPRAGCGCRASLDGDSRYAFLPGTSMAAPQVAAAAALVRSLNPDLGVLEVVRVLKETARRRGTGWEPELGWGLLDAGAAVAAVRRIDRRPPVSRVRHARRTGLFRAVLTWSGRDPGPDGLLTAGITRFELWRSAGGRPPRRIARTRRRSRRVNLQPGRRDAFFTVAVDAAGNREAAPARFDLAMTG